jgi:hypothetical protein
MYLSYKIFNLLTRIFNQTLSNKLSRFVWNYGISLFHEEKNK